MDRKPIIAVAWPRTDYVAALTHAGAEVREITPDRGPLPEALTGCDGVLLTGGVDVDPAEYGDLARHPTVEVDAVRDRYELALTREAVSRDLPLLAICRGVQVLNVAAGGTLVQDLPSQSPSDVRHSVTEPKNAEVHDVEVTAGTCLATLLAPRLTGDRRVPVNSRHHQSVKQAAPGFIVSATAPDGIVEAIERPASRFCVGVQWHPENFWRTGEFKTLFDGFVQAAVDHLSQKREHEELKK
jgi:putative glutamine amidotransferase